MKILTVAAVFAILVALFPVSSIAEPGNTLEPVRFLPDYSKVDFSLHDGALNLAVGVSNFQVLRANRTNPPDKNHRGYTYNHQPQISYWNGRFWLEYLGAHHNESDYRTETFLTSSQDGIHWDAPSVIFPAIEYEPWFFTVAHQRMAFYTSPNGKLLATSFYGIPVGEYRLPNTGKGVGRVVREIKEDGSLGPIYFIRYMPHAGFTRENTAKWYPFFEESSDEDFKAACRSLLANKLMILQWWEEDRAEDGFFTIKGTNDYATLKALSFYHRKDGKVVALWKWKWAALSSDEGKSWTPPVVCASAPYGGAKVWGQRTSDGAYAAVYNPHQEHRWPLVISTGTDGIIFDNLLTVHAEVPPQRFTGMFKDIGPQYTRGIAEGNGNPPGKNMWITYSVNKEDIWVASIPVPVTGKAPYSDDNFQKIQPGGIVPGWNIYSPLWAPVTVERKSGKSYLRLEDSDPYDYAKAVRIFPESKKVSIKFRIRIEKAKTEPLEIELLGVRGLRAVVLSYDPKTGMLYSNNGAVKQELGTLNTGKWYDFALGVDMSMGKYNLALNGRKILEEASVADAEKIKTIGRLEFRTGKYRLSDPIKVDLKPLMNDGLYGADTKVPPSVYFLDDVKTSGE